MMSTLSNAVPASMDVVLPVANEAPSVASNVQTYLDDVSSPGSDVTTVENDVHPLVLDLSTHNGELPPLVADIPALAFIGSIPHTVVTRPCPVCLQPLTANGCRRHLIDSSCGDWLRWRTFRQLVSLEAERSGGDAITFARLNFLLELTFMQAIPEIVSELADLQDAQNMREEVLAMISLEEDAMNRQVAPEVGQSGPWSNVGEPSPNDEEMSIVADGVANLEL